MQSNKNNICVGVSRDAEAAPEAGTSTVREVANTVLHSRAQFVGTCEAGDRSSSVFLSQAMLRRPLMLVPAQPETQRMLFFTAAHSSWALARAGATAVTHPTR